MDLAPDGATATGRWRVLGMLGRYGGSATWADSLYRFDYVKQDGHWKIKSLMMAIVTRNFIGRRVDDVLKRKPGTVLVDARPHNEYLGDDDLWLRKGHIPGAISFHWARLMEKDNTHKFRPFSETKAELEKAGITPDKNIICYCGTSREGSLLLFYLKHVAGYPNVRLYEGAWKEYVWLKDKSLPAEKGGEAAGK